MIEGLPNEIIDMFVSNLSKQEAMQLGFTSKRMYEIVKKSIGHLARQEQPKLKEKIEELLENPREMQKVNALYNQMLINQKIILSDNVDLSLQKMFEKQIIMNILTQKSNKITKKTTEHFNRNAQIMNNVL